MNIYFVKEKQNKISKALDAKKIIDIRLPKPVSILVLGADAANPGDLTSWYSRSDFMALIYINPNTDIVSILSVPRDSRINLDDGSVSKINFANQKGGYRLARKTVEQLTGIKIDNVFVFSIQAVIDLFDQLGSIKIYVPKKMSYHDRKADLHIEIEPGLQTLNGSNLLNFLRYRSADRGDIGRIQRQQVFFRAAIKKLKEPQMIFKMPAILMGANKSFKTDMSFANMFKLGILLRSLSLKNFKSFTVPGDFASNGDWVVKQTQLQSLVKKITDESNQKQKSN